MKKGKSEQLKAESKVKRKGYQAFGKTLINQIKTKLQINKDNSKVVQQLIKYATILNTCSDCNCLKERKKKEKN